MAWSDSFRSIRRAMFTQAPIPALLLLGGLLAIESGGLFTRLYWQEIGARMGVASCQYELGLYHQRTDADHLMSVRGLGLLSSAAPRHYQAALCFVRSVNAERIRNQNHVSASGHFASFAEISEGYAYIMAAHCSPEGLVLRAQQVANLGVGPRTPMERMLYGAADEPWVMVGGELQRPGKKDWAVLPIAYVLMANRIDPTVDVDRVLGSFQDYTPAELEAGKRLLGRCQVWFDAPSARLRGTPGGFEAIWPKVAPAPSHEFSDHAFAMFIAMLNSLFAAVMVAAQLDVWRGLGHAFAAKFTCAVVISVGTAIYIWGIHINFGYYIGFPFGCGMQYQILYLILLLPMFGLGLTCARKDSAPRSELGE